MYPVPEAVMGGWIDTWGKAKIAELRREGYVVQGYCSTDPERGGRSDTWRVDISSEGEVQGTHAAHDLEMAFYGALAALQGTPYPVG